MTCSGRAPAARRTSPAQPESARGNHGHVWKPRRQRLCTPSAANHAHGLQAPSARRHDYDARHGRPGSGQEDRYFVPGVRRRPLRCTKQQESNHRVRKQLGGDGVRQVVRDGRHQLGARLQALRPSARTWVENHASARLYTLCAVHPCAHGFDDAHAVSPWNQTTCRKRNIEPPADHGEVARVDGALGYADHDFAGSRRRRIGKGLQLEDLRWVAEPGKDDASHEFTPGCDVWSDARCSIAP